VSGHIHVIENVPFRTGSPRDLEKPIDFWLRKGKASGELMPTETREKHTKRTKGSSEDQAKKEQGLGTWVEKRNRLRYRCNTTENDSRLDRDFLENGSKKSEKRPNGQKGPSNITSAIQVGYKYNTR